MAKVTKKEIEKVKELTKLAKEKTKSTKEKTAQLEAIARAEEAKANSKAESARRKKPSDRPRSFFIRTYIPFDNLRTFLRSAHWVAHYAMALHDKDVWTEHDEKQNEQHKAGTLKTPHTHVLLYTYNGKTVKSVQRLFDIYSKSISDGDKIESTRVEVPSSMTSAYDYLTHEHDDDKYRYPSESIVSDSPVYWAKHKSTDGLNDISNSAVNMVTDLMDGATERTMIERYGKEYMYHRKYVHDSARVIACEENQFTKVDDALFDMVLDLAPFYEIDKLKFKEIFAYIQSAFSNDLCAQQAFNIYLERKLTK